MPQQKLGNSANHVLFVLVEAFRVLCQVYWPGESLQVTIYGRV